MRTMVKNILCLLLILFSHHAHSEKTVYYHNDALGSPIASTDERGNVLWKEVYAPYDKRTLKQDGGTENVWYTGKQHDETIGLSYFGARWYDPLHGRFMAVDPAPFQEDNIHSFNKYTYANNNPYKFVDPDGEFAVLAAAVIVAYFGSAAVDGILQGYLGGDVANGQVQSLATIPAPLGLGSAKNAVTATKSGTDFFKGAKYTDKVKKQMQQGDFHFFPESVKGFQDAEKVSKLKGVDGVVRDKLEIPGGYRGREGKFEFIKEPYGNINHRLFKPNRK